MIDEKWVQKIREDFPAVNNLRNGKPPIYFDNACTTLVPKQVLQAMNEYYTGYSGCGAARSRHWFAEEVYSRIDGNPEKGIKGSRSVIKKFINARSEKEIIFTIEKKGIINLEHVESDEDDNFDLESFKEKLEHNRVRLVSMAYTSNLTGYTIPAREITTLAHAHGARVLLDAAQTASHQTVDVQDMDVDFLVFSIHKMCGPRGVGVLYGKQELLGQTIHEDEPDDAIEPCLLGGGTARDSTYDSYSLLEPPERFEVGIQNYPGQIAAGTTVEYLQEIGLKKINEHMCSLNKFLTGQLLSAYGDTGWFNIFGPKEANLRGGIITFDVKRPNAVGISKDLSERSNIMIRDGSFCVHSFINKMFGEGWMRPRLQAEHRRTYRISFYLYNTLEECRIFLDALRSVFEERCYL